MRLFEAHRGRIKSHWTGLKGHKQNWDVNRNKFDLILQTSCTAQCASFTFLCVDRRAAETARQVCTELFALSFRSRNEKANFCQQQYRQELNAHPQNFPFDHHSRAVRAHNHWWLTFSNEPVSSRTHSTQAAAPKPLPRAPSTNTKT